VTTIAERVAAGAAHLDVHDPEWWRADVDRAIDLSTLYLSSPRLCILGQRCPLEVLSAAERGMSSFYAYAVELSGLTNRSLDRWAADRGFEVADDEDFADDSEEYAALTIAWINVIAARRSAS
jgi:hypothetical protein